MGIRQRRTPATPFCSVETEQPTLGIPYSFNDYGTRNSIQFTRIEFQTVPAIADSYRLFSRFKVSTHIRDQLYYNTKPKHCNLHASISFSERKFKTEHSYFLSY